MTDIFPKKTPANFRCNICDFNTSNKKDYNKHLLTLKHQNTDKILIFTAKKTHKTQNDLSSAFICECGKEYRHRQSLFTHKKKCYSLQNIKPSNDNKTNDNKDELIEYLVKENKEIKELI